ncbi:MAG TPA: glycosyltransferase, partial [Thermoanaerobaculia bacterium]|nr:glycosyltransferase [Thermoanaerobaculia bacterium]
THGPFVQRLSEELAGLGHEVHVLVPYDPELRPDPASPLAVHAFRYVRPDRWHRLGYSRTLRRDVGLRLAAWLQSPLYFACAVRALRRLIERAGIELVHAHWILPNGFVAARATRGSATPFVVTLHGSDVFMAERNPLFGAMARRALLGAGHVTSCSADLRDRLLALAGSPAPPELAAKVSLVPNGTDLVPPGGLDPDAARRRLGLPEDGRLVAAVGRMVDKKGFGYLLEAAPAILDGRPDVRLVVAGGGDLLPALRERAAALGLGDRVLFPGALAHDRVLDLLAAAEVFVMPSVRDQRGNIDGLPVVVLEAMAAGVPVVATAVAGMPLAVRDGETGLLVPEKDPRALAEAVAGLLDRPETARALGRAGRDRVARELNWAAVARVHDRIYRQAAAGFPAAG